MDTKEIALTALVSIVATGIGGQLFHAQTTGKKLDEVYNYMVETKAVMASVKQQEDKDNTRTEIAIKELQDQVSDISKTIVLHDVTIAAWKKEGGEQ
jgi:hypothetical protein